MYAKTFFLFSAAFLVLGGFVFLPSFRIFFSSNSEKEIETLRLENQRLRAELANVFQAWRADREIPAEIHSTYPLNNKKEITVAAGSADGVKKGSPVTVGGKALLGQIIKVFENYSVVRTVFDPEWEFPVRIGDGRVEALMRGGVEPELAMLEKNKPIKEGDLVYAAAKGFPFGLSVGTVKNIRQSETDVFQEAAMATAYNFNDLREVIILNDY